MLKLRSLIVDDEPLARQIIRTYLQERDDIEIVAECADGFQALKAIQELKPDLILLDIQMPKLDGFELLEVLDHKPAIVFTTAYDQYAIRAFEQNAADYLLKPFSKERLFQALAKVTPGHDVSEQRQKLEKLQDSLDSSEKILGRVVTRLGSRITVIPVHQICYLEAQDDYVMIHSDMGKHLKEKTMKYFEAHLPRESFVRIHRSFIINISQIQHVELYAKDTHLVTLKCGAKLKTSAEGYKRLHGLFR